MLYDSSIEGNETMDFTIPSFCKLPELLSDSELLEINRKTSTMTFRASDSFDGLTPHDKLLRKLEILQLRGEYRE